MINAVRTADWIIENVGADTPLHLVAYHPAFRYTKKRTSIDTLLKLRKIVLDRGLNYCYLGNVYAEEVSNTTCHNCSSTLVKRFGLTVEVVGVDEHNSCKNCGSPVVITESLKGQSSPLDVSDFTFKPNHEHKWDGEINSLHIVIGDDHTEMILKIEHLPKGRIEFVKISGDLERLIISKRSEIESAVRISATLDSKLIYLPVLDRAHFPVEELSKSSYKYLN